MITAPVTPKSDLAPQRAVLRRAWFWVLFAIIIGIGIVIRLVWVRSGGPNFAVLDFKGYHEAAAKMREGILSSYLIYKGPGVVPWYALGFFVTGGTAYINWLLWNTLGLYPLTSLAMYLLAREVVGPTKFALLGPALLAVLPQYAYTAHAVAAENVVPLGVCLSLWGAFRAWRIRSIWSAIFGGMLFAVGLYIRPLFMLIAPFFAFAFFVTVQTTFPFLRVNISGLRNGFVRSVLFTASVVACVMPWWIYTYMEIGRPVISMADYGQLVFFTCNQPFGDTNWKQASLLREELVPEYDRATSDFSQLGRYGWWYLRHHPASVLEDLPVNFGRQFLYQGNMAKWAGGWYQDKSTWPPWKQRVEALVYGAIWLLTALGMVAAGGTRTRFAAPVLRLLLLYTMIVFPLVLMLAIERYRVGTMPIAIAIACIYPSAAAATGSLRQPIVRGIAGFCAGTTTVLREASAAVTRFWKPLCAVGAIALLAGLIAHDWRAIRLTADDLEGGTVTALQDGWLAVPNPVIGVPPDVEAPETYEARFRFDAEGGLYHIAALYSADFPVPIDVSINGRLALQDAFRENFSGAANRFARWKSIGQLELLPGTNVLELRSSSDGPFARGVSEKDLQLAWRELRGKLARRREAEMIPGTGLFPGDGVQLTLNGVRSERPIRAESRTHELRDRLIGGQTYWLTLPDSTTMPPGMVMDLIFTGTSSESDQPEREFTIRFDADHRRGSFTPTTDLTKIRLRLSLHGSGQIALGEKPWLIPEGLDTYETRMGPYIQELRLDRVDD